jgi:hypothetical protein
LRQRILYGTYFFSWIVFIVLIYAYQTDKYYEKTHFFAPISGFLVILISLIAICTLIVLYIIKKGKRGKIRNAILLCLIPFVFLIPLIFHYFQLDKLDEKQQTIELSYVDWACDCANWATPLDLKKYHDNINDTLAKLSMYIEPSNKGLELPDSFYVSGNTIKFTGRFYRYEKFPKHYFSIELPERAKVFQYDRYEIIKPFYVWGQVYPDSIPEPIELK